MLLISLYFENNVFLFTVILNIMQKDEVYLNLVLEYIPETVYKVARQYAKSKQTIPINFIRVRANIFSRTTIRLFMLLYFVHLL